MKATSITHFLVSVSVLLLAGCSTTQQVMIAKDGPGKSIASVSRSPTDDNSSDMDTNLDLAFAREGINVKPPVSPGLRKAPDVDAVVSYSGSWRWDIVMYLRKFSVQLYDAASGDLLATGEWNNSALHGFHDAKEIVQGVVSEMLSKLRSASSNPISSRATVSQISTPETPNAKRLRELEAVRKEGLITESEYQERRKAILSSM